MHEIAFSVFAPEPSHNEWKNTLSSTACVCMCVAFKRERETERENGEQKICRDRRENDTEIAWNYRMQRRDREMMMCPAKQIHFASFPEPSVTLNLPLWLSMSHLIHASHSQTLKMSRPRCVLLFLYMQLDCSVSSSTRFQILWQTCNIRTNPSECERVSALPATESLLTQLSHFRWASEQCFLVRFLRLCFWAKEYSYKMAAPESQAQWAALSVFLPLIRQRYSLNCPCCRLNLYHHPAAYPAPVVLIIA